MLQVEINIKFLGGFVGSQRLRKIKCQALVPWVSHDREFSIENEEMPRQVAGVASGRRTCESLIRLTYGQGASNFIRFEAECHRPHNIG